jgi:hypothetical protein
MILTTIKNSYHYTNRGLLVVLWQYVNQAIILLHNDDDDDTTPCIIIIIRIQVVFIYYTRVKAAYILYDLLLQLSQNPCVGFIELQPQLHHPSPTSHWYRISSTCKMKTHIIRNHHSRSFCCLLTILLYD